MCIFCECSEKEIEQFYNWANTNPHKGDKQTTKEGIDYILDGNTFTIVALFDGGYIYDGLTVNFKYCPICGHKL